MEILAQPKARINVHERANRELGLRLEAGGEIPSVPTTPADRLALW